MKATEKLDARLKRIEAEIIWLLRHFELLASRQAEIEGELGMKKSKP